MGTLIEEKFINDTPIFDRLEYIILQLQESFLMFIISIILIAIAIYSLSVFCFIKFYRSWDKMPLCIKILSLIPYANTVIAITLILWLLMMVVNLFWNEKIMKK